MNQWEAFFDAHAPNYLRNGFTANTAAEVDFLLHELAPPPGSWILDVGCGTGRHSLELARRGYQVTGVDISQGMLDQARAANPDLDWVKCDATRFVATRAYDAAICLCEGAFGLIGGLDDDPLAHDTAILRNVHAALKPGARFLLNTLNPYRVIRRLTAADVTEGRFDPATMVARVTEVMELPEGPREVTYRERCHFPPELAALMGSVGLRVLHIWGGTAGLWERGRPIDPDEMEYLVIAERP